MYNKGICLYNQTNLKPVNTFLNPAYNAVAAVAVLAMVGKQNKLG